MLFSAISDQCCCYCHGLVITTVSSIAVGLLTLNYLFGTKRESLVVSMAKHKLQWPVRVFVRYSETILDVSLLHPLVCLMGELVQTVRVQAF